jgi:hypothetical protein
MTRLALALAVLLLGACSKEPASYQIADADVSITVERTRDYFWQDGWALNMIVRRVPDCQRRHAMKPTGGNNVKIDVYSPDRGVYILRQGKRWYVTELNSCGFQAYKEPPPEPGELLGSFQEKEGVFKFFAATQGGVAEKAGEGG